MNWSLKHIEELKAKGLIRHYNIIQKILATNDQKSCNGRIVAKHFQKRSKPKDYISRTLLDWCNERGVTLEEEFRFDPRRKYRADWCVPAYKILVEYEGGIFMAKSGHTNVKGISRDIAKYHSAQALGYKVLRFTALNYLDLITELNRCL